MGIKLANNASSKIAATISMAATSIAVTSGEGSKFPVLGVGDFFMATLVAADSSYEIVKVTARASDVLTVQRAKEATVAIGFAIGSRIELRMTAGTLDMMLEDRLASITTQMDAIRAELPKPGDIMIINATAPRTGWLKANGALYSRTARADLWAYAQTSGSLVSDVEWAAGAHGCYSTGDGATTFRVPELRGDFLRFADDGRGVDTDRLIGRDQAQQLLAHGHGITDPGHGHGITDPGHSHGITDPGHAHPDVGGVAGPFTGGGSIVAQSNSGSHNTSSTNTNITVNSANTNITINSGNTGITVQPTGGTENRPRNMALMAVIKY